MLPVDCRSELSLSTQSRINTFEEMPTRELRFPDPYSWTDHAEITTTNLCYLIAAKRWCEGCTAVNAQDVEEVMTHNASDGMPRMNAAKVIEAHEALKRMGINFITDMGGENLTIPGYEAVVKDVAADPVLDALVYSSSMYFLKSDGTPNKKFDEYERAGLFGGGMYLLSSVDHLITSRDRIPHNADGSYPKAYAGLRLVEWLVNHGYNRHGVLGIHMVIRRNNIGQILPLYNWAGDRRVWFSYCDLVHRPYTSRRRNRVSEEFYADRLDDGHKEALEEAIGTIISDESERLRRGEPRRTVPSSAFARMSKTYGPGNELNCRDHRGGLLPNTFDVHPSGQLRACIAQNTVEDVLHCDGCSYISIDRGNSDYAPFERTLFGAKSGDMVWRNAIVNRKHPAFRPDRKNLVFAVNSDKSIVPFYPDVSYYQRTSTGLRAAGDGRESLVDATYYSYPTSGNIFEKSGYSV